jgi:hypothetical protein
MKSIVEAVFARMPGSVCKRDALLKWCVGKLAHYVSEIYLLSNKKKYRLNREYQSRIFRIHGLMELHFVHYYIHIYPIELILK